MTRMILQYSHTILKSELHLRCRIKVGFGVYFTENISKPLTV